MGLADRRKAREASRPRRKASSRPRPTLPTPGRRGALRPELCQRATERARSVHREQRRRQEPAGSMTDRTTLPRGLNVRDLTTLPFADDDKLHEECGVFGIFGHDDAAALTVARPARPAASRAGGGRHRFLRRQPVPPGAPGRGHRRQLHRPRRHRPARRQPRHRPCPLRHAMAVRSSATSSRSSPSSPAAGSPSPITAISPTPSPCRTGCSGAARSSSRPRTPRSSSTSSRPADASASPTR